MSKVIACKIITHGIYFPNSRIVEEVGNGEQNLTSALDTFFYSDEKP